VVLHANAAASASTPFLLASISTQLNSSNVTFVRNASAILDKPSSPMGFPESTIDAIGHAFDDNNVAIELQPWKALKLH
jgi:hypothetical protein